MADINMTAKAVTAGSLAERPAAGAQPDGAAGEPVWDIIELLFFAYRDFVGDPDEVLSKLAFGRAPHPVKTRRGLVLGGGRIYPELNFTLPPIAISPATMPEIREHYRQIVSGALKRGRELRAAGIVFEFETLLEMTLTPSIGVELVEIMNALCEEAWQRHGFPSELRLTPNDTRDFERPPRARTSHSGQWTWSTS